MSQSVYDLRDFYRERPGRLVRRLLVSHVQQFWPDLSNIELAGYGYAPPYLRALGADAGRVYALMPSKGGGHHWPEDGESRVAIVDEEHWPLEAESVDRLLIVHALEYAEHPDAVLHEAWRVLKSGGRALIVVPSRIGFWARADWTPFGHGTPFTGRQITRLLQACGLVKERSERALFMPPFRSFMILASAYTVEAFGKFLFPGLAGVYMVEVSKQVYPGRIARTHARQGRRKYRGAPVTAGAAIGSGFER